MDTSILFEQLTWALNQEILDGKSVEYQQDAQKIHSILKEALEGAYENGHSDGYEEGRCDFQINNY